MPTNIFVADDHDVVREGLKSLLSARLDWIIAGEASNGLDAVARIGRINPDVAVLDITMPGMNGLDVARQIRKTNRDVRILIFTMHDGITLSQVAQEVGANGLVLKSFASRDLVRAIDAVLEGETFFYSCEGSLSQPRP
jgi:DNA-binding NarL/FixJ family response regulator